MKKIIIKYLANTINSLELAKLKLWLKTEKNQKTFEQYIKASYDINTIMNKPDVEVAYKKLRQTLDGKKKSKVRILTVWSRYAAAAVVVIMFSYIYMFHNQEQQPVEVLNTFETVVAPEESTPAICFCHHKGTPKRFSPQPAAKLFRRVCSLSTSNALISMVWAGLWRSAMRCSLV